MSCYSSLMSKLVRDRIPDIIRESGRQPRVKRISGDELREALKAKLVEEANELRRSDDIYEELADVLEVIDAIIEQNGIDPKKLAGVKAAKLKRAGGFRDGLYLLSENDDKHKV